ncbi:MAG: hypothetical protein H0U89_10420, partial [Acidimicrobiia bacterium]|nr:hypothetical protein [Acidimicrobiia bacterium]
DPVPRDLPAEAATAEAKPHGDALEHLARSHPGVEAEAGPVPDEPAPGDPEPHDDPLEHLVEAGPEEPGPEA